MFELPWTHAPSAAQHPFAQLWAVHLFIGSVGPHALISTVIANPAIHVFLVIVPPRSPVGSMCPEKNGRKRDHTRDVTRDLAPCPPAPLGAMGLLWRGLHSGATASDRSSDSQARLSSSHLLAVASQVSRPSAW